MIEHLSYSSITRYLSCGKSWQHNYLLETEKQGDDSNMRLGTAVHNAIQKHLVTGVPMAELYERSFAEQFGNNGNEKLFNAGYSLVSNSDIYDALDSIEIFGEIAPEGIEYKTSLEVPSVPVPIIGYIDILQSNGVPIDIKTSSKSWSQERADNELQPTLYLASLVQSGLVTLPAKFTYLILVKTKTPKIQVIDTWRNGQDITKLFNIIQGVWNGISKEVFVHNPTTWQCSQNYCDFWHVCQGGLR